jgi:hypothetical protein
LLVILSIADANTESTDITLTLSIFFLSGNAIESVTTTSFKADFSSLSIAGSEKTA